MYGQNDRTFVTWNRALVPHLAILHHLLVVDMLENLGQQANDACLPMARSTPLVAALKHILQPVMLELWNLMLRLDGYLWESRPSAHRSLVDKNRRRRRNKNT